MKNEVSHTLVNFATRLKYMVFLVAVCISISSEANCLSQAKTAYERVYCEIVEKGEGRSLPAFEDFKRNDAIVQKLLLKRPAARLKIKMPNSPVVASKNTPNASYNSSPSNNSLPINKASRKPNVEPQKKADLVLPSHALRLSQCTLFVDHIKCGSRQFKIKVNQPNHRLALGVLDDGYLMNLPPYRGAKGNNIETQYYLSEVYGVYIRKMVDIGLGASTMSYTRFYRTFHDLQAKNVSFTARFETMYRYLKKDKKTMVVKATLSDQRPDNIAQCDDITDHTIVCDNGAANWVYIN